MSATNYANKYTQRVQEIIKTVRDVMHQHRFECDRVQRKKSTSGIDGYLIRFNTLSNSSIPNMGEHECVTLEMALCRALKTLRVGAEVVESAGRFNIHIVY